VEDIDADIFDIYEDESEDILEDGVYEEEEEEPAEIEDICPNCGAVVPEGAKRCKSCGETL
jgi:ribosomal protein L40E